MEETPKRHIACGICRRRKLKCDGRKPVCSTCQRLNQVCEYSDFVRKAGPKRGYVRSLETRIQQLESMLNSAHISESPSDEIPVIADAELPKQVVTDLTEVFFLKCNIAIGVLDRRRYLASLDYPAIHQPPPYLQYAVMVSAAAITPKYYSYKPLLYERAQKYLRKAEDALSEASPSIYYIAALGLMGHYNLREKRLRAAWMDIGKAWRTIIMLSLNMLDASTWRSRTLETAAVVEARRIFWFIYFCDRAGSIGTSLPPIINPDDVFVKLPMDDEAFLTGSLPETECFRMEELLASPNMFTQHTNARLALTCCICEANYQILQLGRFPHKKFTNKPHEWLAEFTHFDTILSNLISVVPLVPPVPAQSTEGNKVLTEEKSRRTAFLLVYIWAQAGILLATRTGLNGVQQFPMILPMANPGRLVQRLLMAMLEVLLVTRNPHDLEVIGMHPVYPIVLFSLALIILVLAEHNLVSLDNFRAPVEYIMNTLRELTAMMPAVEMLSDALVHLAPQLARRDMQSVNRVEDVLQHRTVDLSLPNFLDGSLHSNESSPISSIGSEKPPGVIQTPSPCDTHVSRHAVPPSTAGVGPPSRSASISSPGGNPTMPTADSGPMLGMGPAVTREYANLQPVYDEPFDESLLDIEPPIYLPEVKDEFEMYNWT